ncbi:hypothetical protein KVF89_05405, partial [Nocardioides carbamazepini]|nr:hypothetical protein [Nocardioides carbamazepini]
MLLLVAGKETTTNLLGGMFETFARNPEQYDRVRENPDLIPMAIEEHMRFSSPIQNLYRYTARRLRCCWWQNSQRVKGASLLRCRESRPVAFEDPNTYRADRNPKMHVGFGHGAQTRESPVPAQARERVGRSPTRWQWTRCSASGVELHGVSESF